VPGNDRWHQVGTGHAGVRRLPPSSSAQAKASTLAFGRGLEIALEVEIGVQLQQIAQCAAPSCDEEFTSAEIG